MLCLNAPGEDGANDEAHEDDGEASIRKTNIIIVASRLESASEQRCRKQR